MNELSKEGGCVCKWCVRMYGSYRDVGFLQTLCISWRAKEDVIVRADHLTFRTTEMKSNYA